MLARRRENGGRTTKNIKIRLLRTLPYTPDVSFWFIIVSKKKFEKYILKKSNRDIEVFHVLGMSLWFSLEPI